ncbi:hypothetical protein PFICI_05817 [Pestalotiopsis fici W106-1]|uniref:Dihydroxyacetone kinase n=1 Tax=Pestalotiopsis fici (strain W106-1 / CGMCC3.15140) TaxID=1229662 RepID=W3XFE8_PESFW|nr:uncharacterized protein PFICI_05817 [Pestalotiopsis fici W106-1]ETS83941.1 hypothetical protein PFICI_05817 [Pestalotiopsis fici W106-1]
MSRKHFIDGEDAKDLVQDALRGLTVQHPELVLDVANKTVYNSRHDSNECVSVVSGGGAGHEPAHAMLVGNGMLAAAVSGNIFASPGVPQIFQCIQRIHGTAGTIVVLKNYTGDVFHFSLAIEKLRANFGARVEIVVVGDDVAVGRRKGGKVGRRGLAGTVLMHKILGSMAVSRESIEKCMAMAAQVNKGLATMAVSLDHVRIPGQPLSETELQDEIELGMGIHNEPGSMRLRPQPEIKQVVEIVLSRLLDTNDEDRGFVDFSGAEDVVLMINNLGSLSVLELSAITWKIHEHLGRRGIKPSRTYSGTFMTSLNGPGFSVTLLRANAEMLRHLDTATDAPGWPVSVIASRTADPERSISLSSLPLSTGIRNESNKIGPKVDYDLFRQCVMSACQAGIAAVPNITRYDTIVGDGDCGITLQRGCESVLGLLKRDQEGKGETALTHILRIARAVEENMDGTSGAIYGLFVNGLAASIRTMESEKRMGHEQWVRAAHGALFAVQKVTPARSGDRTLMDALEPFIAALTKNGVDAALQAAAQGAESTKGMRPAFGRAVYVNEEGWDQVPDPGAVGIVALVEGLLKNLQ